MRGKSIWESAGPAEGQAGGLGARLPEKGKNASELICSPPVGTKLNWTVGLGGVPTLV